MVNYREHWCVVWTSEKIWLRNLVTLHCLMSGCTLLNNTAAPSAYCLAWPCHGQGRHLTAFEEKGSCRGSVGDQKSALREKRWSIFPVLGGPSGRTLLQGYFTIQRVLFTTPNWRYDHRYSLTCTVPLVTLTTVSARMGSQSYQWGGFNNYTIGDTHI